MNGWADGDRVAAYFRYWGKASRESRQAEPCHLLPFHALDVAAVGHVLLEARSDLLASLASVLELDHCILQQFLVFSLAIHDLGKFARAFQSLAEPGMDDLVPPIPGMAYQTRHDALGAQVWSDKLVDEVSGLRRLDQPVDLDVIDATQLWLGCFFGHHGKPVAAVRSSLRTAFVIDEDVPAARDYVTDVAALLGQTWPLKHLEDPVWCRVALAPTTWQLAGFAILADWLGSNTRFFRYRAQPMPLEEYWSRCALPGAHDALQASGLIQPPSFSRFPGFREQFGFEPTPLQAWAETVPVADGPQLFLLEDVTGAGKTEGALTLVHRLLEQDLGDGLYFGLPTMATSNAMYRRLGKAYRSLYDEEALPSLVLAHGARDLDKAFRASVLEPPNRDGAYSREDETAGIECRAWLADNRKKALLADVGVGTIDQALLGVLPRRHQSLRLFGLRRKVLVVDEVHAYDVYTRELLCRLLAGHARAGGSAILLTATLPKLVRRELLTAWGEGRGVSDVDASECADFPLATHVSDAASVTVPIDVAPASARELPVALLGSADEAIERVLEASRSGRCVCWVRNTVDEAVDAFRAVRDRIGADESVLLFHARFAMADRQRIEAVALDRFGKQSGAEDRRGQVLIATQVVEQSLDLDFDELVTDLAPIELLIQRAGRLHRHCRDPDGNLLAAGQADQRVPPTLNVLAPSWTDSPDADWVRRTLRGTSHVYPDLILWRSCGVLRDRGAIRMPSEARLLLESVYGEAAPCPEGLMAAHDEHWAQERVDASTARFNALDLSRGYTLRGSSAAWDDDQEIGTRLARERTIQVALAVERGRHIDPWHNEEDYPWQMSSLTLRESQARKLPELPGRLEEARQSLCDAMPFMKHTRIWLPEDGADVTYDPVLGVVLPRRSNRKLEEVTP